MSGHRIAGIVPGSIAEEMEIAAGDLLLSINGFEIRDIFDYHYLVSDESVTVLIGKPDGEQWELEIEKDYEEDLGIIFAQSLLDEYHSCQNKCIFCFIDQMPPGMRETLYFKDDDSRLSFLQGNYVTLTNLSDEDLDRIRRFHLAPINVSVHTTDPELRCRMLRNRFAGQALDKMRSLAEAGIEMNSQVVLCKDWNDGAELDRTIADLAKMYPAMQSMSVVPMGMTKFREGLVQVEKFTSEDARHLLDQVDRWQARLLERIGCRFVHASDEWFLMAGREIPAADYYEGYGQIENGVGMVRSFLDEWHQALETWKEERRWSVGQSHPTQEGRPARADQPAGAEAFRSVSCATGRLFAPILERCVEELRAHDSRIHIHVYPIRNDFFGEDITVAGLVTAQDIVAQLKGRELGSCLLLPDTMLRSGEQIFLDDMTVQELAQVLQVDVRIVRSDGAAFLQGIYGF